MALCSLCRVRPIGINYDSREDLRRLLAQRLVDASADDATRRTDTQAIFTQLSQVTQLQSEHASLRELRQWTECFVALQTQWVECGARLDSEAALRLWEQLDAFICSVVAQQDRSRQLTLLQKRLPKLAASATALIQKQSQQPAKSSIHSTASPSTDVDTRVELTYQWAPRVLRKIGGSVEHEASMGRCSQSLVVATRRMLGVIRDYNPYAFLSVLYRPPPPAAPDATTAVAAATPQWVLRGSSHVDAVARILRDDFDTIYELAWWMAAPDTTFWKSFKQLITRVRHVAVAFHHVMLHLYATAMERQDPNVTSLDVAFEIEREIERQQSFTLQSDGYGLARHLATADNPILEETYTMFPEVLVYVDQWRHEVSLFEHGFAPKERARDYEIGFRRWKSSKAWQEIAHHAKRMVQTWRQSRLGAGYKFHAMTFAELGKLEEEIKYRLGEITDMLYRQNLAKWSQQRYQHARARALMELRILEPKDASRDGVERVASEAGESVDSKPVLKQFRQPTKTKQRTIVKTKDSEMEDGRHCTGVSTAQYDEESVLKWTDDEIDGHEQETEHVYELQAGILAASDSLVLPALLAGDDDSTDEDRDGNASNRADSFFDDEVDGLASVRGLIASCRRLRSVTRRVVSQSEEIALHGAAEALIQRPSLRIVDSSPLIDEPDEDIDAGDDEEESVDDMEEDGNEDEDQLIDGTLLDQLASCSDTLEDSLLNSAERILDLHQAAEHSADTAAEAHAVESIHRMAIEALSLLRFAHQQTA